MLVNIAKRIINIEEALSNIDCKVLNAVKGGLTVNVLGINGFMPASHVSTSYVSDLDQYRGRAFKRSGHTFLEAVVSNQAKSKF